MFGPWMVTSETSPFSTAVRNSLKMISGSRASWRFSRLNSSSTINPSTSQSATFRETWFNSPPVRTVTHRIFCGNALCLDDQQTAALAADQGEVAAHQSGNPEDLPAGLDHRPPRALEPRHLGIDEHVLELLRAPQAERPDTVPRLRATHRQRRVVQRPSVEDRPPRAGLRSIPHGPR